MKNKEVKCVDIECMRCLFCVSAKKNKLKCAKGHELTQTSGHSCQDKNVDYEFSIKEYAARGK